MIYTWLDRAGMTVGLDTIKKKIKLVEAMKAVAKSLNKEVSTKFLRKEMEDQVVVPGVFLSLQKDGKCLLAAKYVMDPGLGVYVAETR